MRGTWATMSVLLWACASAGAGGPQMAAKQPGARLEAAGMELGPKRASLDLGEMKTSAQRSAKTVAGEAQCKPMSGAEPKVVTGDASVSDVADTGRALIFDIAGIALELPACTPDADLRVMTVSWDTKGRPNAARIHPKFVRHAATLRADQVIVAAEGAPILVRLHSKRELAKAGEKLVLAVESSGECDAQHKHDKLEDGDCSHWQLFDATFDAERNEMVARIPATGGYRLQFGWVPAK